MICVPSKQLNRIGNAYGSTGDTTCQINNFVRHITLRTKRCCWNDFWSSI